jgi:anti-anti-sigma factor
MLSDRGILVELRPAYATAYVAVVALRGEHDLATCMKVADALAPIDGDVLLDLTGCEFIDATVIGVVVSKLVSLQREGHRLDLLIDPATYVARVVDIVRLGDVVTVLRELPVDQGAFEGERFRRRPPPGRSQRL